MKKKIEEVQSKIISKTILENDSLSNQTVIDESIMSLKGVGPSTYEKLILNGYQSILNIASTNPRLLASKCDLTEKLATSIVFEAQKLIDMDKFINAEEVLKNRKNLTRLKFNITSIDEMLFGGLDSQTVSEIYGESGIGKTQLCFKLAINCTITKFDDLEKPGIVIFLDTENSFRPERIVEICKKNKINSESVLKNILYIRILNTSHQIFVIEKLKLQKFFKRIKLIIVDSVTSHFRTEYIGRGYLSERQQMLNLHLKELHNLSIIANCVVVVTNQVFSKPDVFYGDPIKPVGGHVMAHSSTYRFYLKRAKEGKRILKLISSPNHPESEALFSFKDL